MKKILKYLIIISVFLGIFYISNTYAASIDTTVDFWWIITDCTSNWNGSTCTVDNWSSAIKNILWWIIKYATFLVWLIAVLFIVVNWIMYSMWGMDQSMKEESKKRIVKTLIWIIVLLMSWTILNLIAPWIYK